MWIYRPRGLGLSSHFHGLTEALCLPSILSAVLTTGSRVGLNESVCVCVVCVLHWLKVMVCINREGDLCMGSSLILFYTLLVSTFLSPPHKASGCVCECVLVFDLQDRSSDCCLHGEGCFLSWEGSASCAESTAVARVCVEYSRFPILEAAVCTVHVLTAEDLSINERLKGNLIKRPRIWSCIESLFHVFLAWFLRSIYSSSSHQSSFIIVFHLLYSIRGQLFISLLGGRQDWRRQRQHPGSHFKSLSSREHTWMSHPPV